MYQQPPLPPSESLPTMYDLKSEDPTDSGVPDEFHVFQPQLLRETFRPPNFSIDEIFVGTDINLYYDARHTLWYKRPDWFTVVGVPRSIQQQDLRLSYVIWQERISPLLVVELLSPGTEDEDLGQTLRDVDNPPTKWEVYEQILRVPYYAVFDRYENRFRAFRLRVDRYQELDLSKGKFWIEDVQLGLGCWRGIYEGVEGIWLRWYDAAESWLPTLAEQAKQERQRSERLAAQLRALGIEPEL